MLLVDRSVRDLLAAFSSSDPTPGGGSASALASAVGASLLIMVAGLPKTRDNSGDDRRALQAAATALSGSQRALTEAIDADTAAYDRVVAAYKLPKSTEAEQAARRAAVQDALRAATDVPLGVMRASVEALGQAAVVGARGNPSAASDVDVARALLLAGAAGARRNVETNLESVKDQAYAERVRGAVTSLSSALR